MCYLPSLCGLPSVWMNKRLFIFFFEHSLYTAHRDRTLDRKEERNGWWYSQVWFMRDLVLFALGFAPLAVTFPFDDETLKSLFWIGDNYHYPLDLPDLTGLKLRDAMFQCLKSILPQSRTWQDPEPGPPSPRCAEREPEPTADGELEHAMTNEPSSNGATEDFPGARAPDVRPCARASYSARHEGERYGQREHGGKLRPLHHGWERAELSGLCITCPSPIIICLPWTLCQSCFGHGGRLWTICLPWIVCLMPPQRSNRS